MTQSIETTIRQRVHQIETMPSIPAVFLPLLKMLGNSDDARVDEVARLVSYDSAIAAQCLHMAASPLFGLAEPPKSIKAAVFSLGLRRVESILLTCSLGKAFPANKSSIDPTAFWRHSLGCVRWCARNSARN